jgi:hypothetical protein
MVVGQGISAILGMHIVAGGLKNCMGQERHPKTTGQSGSFPVVYAVFCFPSIWVAGSSSRFRSYAFFVDTVQRADFGSS